LLDHSLYLYGSGIGNPNVHDHTNLPILVAGGTAAGMKGGRHIKYEKPKPLANLHLTLLDKVGVHLDKFADSDGKVDELFEPLAVLIPDWSARPGVSMFGLFKKAKVEALQLEEGARPLWASLVPAEGQPRRYRRAYSHRRKAD